MADTQDTYKELRKPFPKEVVGKIPKGGVQLDYVGHAAVTDRLLSVDPTWTWEPLALDEVGLPAYDDRGGLWIRLTVNGVTRLGYGDGPDPKQRIGDALRNAAMRFGVALDLWTKDELESQLDAAPAIPKPLAPPSEPVSMGKLRQAFIAKRMMGPAVIEFSRTWLKKDKPETEQDVITLLKALDDMPEGS